jgi:hypothetical protein
MRVMPAEERALMAMSLATPIAIRTLQRKLYREAKAESPPRR